MQSALESPLADGGQSNSRPEGDVHVNAVEEALHQPSIGDYYHRCVNCRHGTCITEERIAATKALVDAGAQGLQSLIDKVEKVEYAVSTITSAFLQQKRALESELLALDLAHGAILKEQAECEGMQEDFMRRAQKHVTQRNFLRRFAGQQQIQLVHRFGPRVHGKGARGGGPSDDTLFNPVVIDNDLANKALVGYGGEPGNMGTAEVPMVGDTFGTPILPAAIPSVVSLQGDGPAAPAVGDRGGARQSEGPHRVPSLFGSSQQRSRSPFVVGIDAPHGDHLQHSQGAAVRRRSSQASGRGGSRSASVGSTASTVSENPGGVVGSRHGESLLPTAVDDAYDSEGGIDDVIQRLKNDKKRRKDRRKVSTRLSLFNVTDDDLKVEKTRKGSVGKKGQHQPPPGTHPPVHHGMRRARQHEKPVHGPPQGDEEVSALDAADRAAEVRSSEVDALIRRLDNSTRDVRADNVLAWYRARLADELEARSKAAAEVEAARILQAEDDLRRAAEADVLKRRQERERQLFSAEYAAVRKGVLSSESEHNASGECEGGSLVSSVASKAATVLSPAPPALAQKSIFDNPKYRLAAMKAMAANGRPSTK